MHTEFDWKLMLELEKGTPLFTTFPNAILLRQQSLREEALYQIGFHAYVSKSQYAPIITHAAWAASSGSAQRILCGDLKADDGAVSTPPEALLLEPGCLSHEQIKCAAESGKFGNSRSFGSDARPDWRHSIFVGDLTYFFRSPEEPLFGIWIDYRGIRWRLCG